jgi:hypothetical protein
MIACCWTLGIHRGPSEGPGNRPLRNRVPYLNCESRGVAVAWGLTVAVGV